MEPLKVAVIIGSVRPGRRGEAVARWVHEQAVGRDGMKVELVDLADFALPVLDEPLPAAYGPTYANPHTTAWSQAVVAFDAFVFVTPEYNRSIPGALKNAIDFLYEEWHDKAAGFVSYGVDAGGARSVDHLRVVMGELHIADVRAQVGFSVFEEFADGGDGPFRPHARRAAEVGTLLDQLQSWGTALRGVRS